MAFPRMNDCETQSTHSFKHHSRWLDGRRGEADVERHLIAVPAGFQEVGLHVDDNERGILWRPGAVKGPSVGIGLDLRKFHVSSLRSQGCKKLAGRRNRSVMATCKAE